MAKLSGAVWKPVPNAFTKASLAGQSRFRASRRSVSERLSRKKTSSGLKNLRAIFMVHRGSSTSTPKGESPRAQTTSIPLWLREKCGEGLWASMGFPH
ncbi:MAG: hypothetical protein K2G28_02490 [Acetatifactor sp.]|nr:hypothetical protein [Acetatifactor sp.]